MASLSPVSYFSWSLEQDIPKLAPIPTLEWTISFFLEWSRFFKWTSCPSENHLFGIIRKRKRWNHFHKREYDWSHLITLVHILKSKSYIVLRNVQYYAIDLPVDLYSETCQSHCGFIYKIKLKRTPSCSKKRIDSSMKKKVSRTRIEAQYHFYHCYIIILLTIRVQAIYIWTSHPLKLKPEIKTRNT